MLNKLHEVLKRKDGYSVTIRLWPIDEVDVIILESEPFCDPKPVLSINEELLENAIPKAIAYLESCES